MREIVLKTMKNAQDALECAGSLWGLMCHYRHPHLSFSIWKNFAWNSIYYKASDFGIANTMGWNPLYMFLKKIQNLTIMQTRKNDSFTPFIWNVCWVEYDGLWSLDLERKTHHTLLCNCPVFAQKFIVKCKWKVWLLLVGITVKCKGGILNLL